MEESLFFTVFTPTYNRADKIHRVFESLMTQTYTNFEWLIIDDGSTDKTREIVEDFIKKARFPVKYIWQKNQGKHIASNNGLYAAKGYFFLCADSDDKFTPDTLKVFYDTWISIPENKRDEFCGVRLSVMDQYGNRVSDDYSAIEPFDAFFQEAFYIKRFRKETWWMLKTTLHKQFLFPEQFVGVLVPEGIVLRKINTQYKTRCVNKTTRIYFTDYNEFSLMKGNKNPHKQALSACIWAGTVINDWVYFLYDIKFFTKSFLTYCIYWPIAAQKMEVLKILNPIPKIYVILFMPFSIIPGMLFHLYKKIK